MEVVSRSEVFPILRDHPIAFIGDSLTRQIYNRWIHWARG